MDEQFCSFKYKKYMQNGEKVKLYEKPCPLCGCHANDGVQAMDNVHSDSDAPDPKYRKLTFVISSTQSTYTHIHI